MLSTLQVKNPTLGEQFVAPRIPQLINAFLIILNHHVMNDVEKATEEYGLKINVVKCICTDSAEFPKYISNKLPQPFEPIWMDLFNLEERYVEELITDSCDVGEHSKIQMAMRLDSRICYMFYLISSVELVQRRRLSIYLLMQKE